MSPSADGNGTHIQSNGQEERKEKGDRTLRRRIASTSTSPPVTTYHQDLEMAQPIPDKTFNAADIISFNGQNSTPIYIALKGTVFDVTKGSDFYGVGTKYNIFAGHDATYGLGKMSLETVDLDKDASGLTSEEMAAVDKFYNLFMSKYTPVGKYVSNSKM